ncbi:MAG: LytTR family transcriptional regulator [Alistipes sp.]|nr:LytTR family transcriptional regulator [Alistipes sp.]
MFETEIPKFLISRRYIWALITFIFLFSILFMVLYDRYALSVWFSTADMERFSFTILFYFAAVMILILSRSLMFMFQDRLALTWLQFALWMMSENVVISALYTYITATFFPVSGTAIPDIALRALFCVTMILAIPNGLVSFYAAYRTRCEELQAAQYELQRVNEENIRIKQLAAERERLTATVQRSEPDAPRMVHLHDYNGTLRLTINLDTLYYMESEDNYIKVYYKHNEKIQSYMLRCRTSDVEKSLEGTSMVRCHRSYIVNIRKIQFVGEEHRMRYIKLNDESLKQIPVSKSYYESLLSKLRA